MATLIEITPAAAAEARAAIRWYADRDERAARGFEVEFANALKVVSEISDSFAVYRKGAKRCLFKRYPYQLIFRVLLDRVQIFAVADLRRNPDYWIRRLK